MKLLRALMIVFALSWAATTTTPAYSQGIGTPEYYIGYGKGYLEKKEYDLAAMYFRQALDRDPENAEAHFLLGAAYMGEGKVADAEAVLARAYELDPSLRARAGEIPKPRAKPVLGAAPAKPAKPATPATPATPAKKPAASTPAKPAKPATAIAKCDDLYATCRGSATQCNMNGCQTDFTRQSACTSERNQCYRRNGK